MKRVKEDQKERSLLQVLSKMISFPRGDLRGYNYTQGQRGFWGTRRLAKLAVGYSKPPAPERPIIHVCVRLTDLAQNYFLFEEMLR